MQVLGINIQLRCKYTNIYANVAHKNSENVSEVTTFHQTAEKLLSL
jgi:hypothetical protein